MEYHKYINSKEWKKKSKKFIEESEGCEKCGSFHKLTCHHKNYLSLGFEKKKDIMVLCWDCHKKYHRKKGKRILTKDYEKKLKKVRENLEKPKTIRNWKKKIEKEMGWEYS